MATIPSLSHDLDALSVQLRTEVSSILLTADTTGLTTVMGAGCTSAGRVAPVEMAATIKGDQGLQKAMEGLDAGVKGQISRAVRALMEEYATKVADGTYATTVTEMEARVMIPILGRARGCQGVLRAMDDKLSELKASAVRIQSAGVNSQARDQAALSYAEDITFVTKTAVKLNRECI
jgi:hypothetical protein